MAIIMDCKGTGAADGLPLNSSSITAAFLEVEPICRHTYETMLNNVLTVDSCVRPGMYLDVRMAPAFARN